MFKKAIKLKCTRWDIPCGGPISAVALAAEGEGLNLIGRDRKSRHARTHMRAHPHIHTNAHKRVTLGKVGPATLSMAISGA